MEISRDDLIDLLDGEGVIVSDGMDVCFSHQTFLNNKCLECGYGPEGDGDHGSLSAENNETGAAHYAEIDGASQRAEQRAGGD